MKLRELGEDRLIAQLVARLESRRGVIVGPGDDCAVLAGTKREELLLLKTDCVVEGVHFLPDEKPGAIAWKAMMRTLSDFAAMSGIPQYVLVTLVAPAESEARWMKQLYQGLRRAAARFKVAIVGGETGDLLYVTGRLGGSLRKRHLNFIPRLKEARWLTQHFRIHAMMDLSDGLGADLPRLANASAVGFEIDEKTLPRTRGCSIAQAINDGEDYELLFALSPNDAATLERKWRKKFMRLSLTRIGHLTRRPSPVTHRSFHGYTHFH
jgi:thiamine-monophosphate kinase